MGKSGEGAVLSYVILCLLTRKAYLRVTQKPAGGLQRELISESRSGLILRGLHHPTILPSFSCLL